MSRHDRSRIAFALILILAGVWFLAVQYYPPLQEFAINGRTWPLIVVGFAAAFALLGLVTWTPGWLVPASLFGGLGGLLYWQNATGEWASWAYAWTLIPGFAGVGVFFSSLLEGKVRQAVSGGMWLVVISLILFTLFGSFLGGPLVLGVYWPALLILLGLVILVQGFFRR
ncbi:MAG: hypothetical protein M1482_08625 [Chloroflexi bacterium]|nr:hypothetical protein [Chloroflexota bacterium]